MSCLINTIQSKIVKNATSYIIRDNEIVIPVTKTRTKKAAFQMAIKKVKELNKEFNSAKFGEVVSLNTLHENGVGIRIHPSKKLRDAYEVRAGKKSIQQFEKEAREMQQRDAERAGIDYNDRYLFDSRVRQKPAAVEKPLGDNIEEFLQWKLSEIDKIEKSISKVKFELRFSDTTENRLRLKKLEATYERLLNQVKDSKNNKKTWIFHAIDEDLQELDDALNSDDIHDTSEIKIKIDWYEKFNEQFDNEYSEEATEISKKIGSLLYRYTKANRDKSRKILEDDTQIQKTKENLNKDEKAREKLGKEDGEDIDLDDLLKATKDIGVLGKMFYGNITSWTGDTIIPQFIMNETMKVLNKHENRVLSIIERLEEFSESNENVDRNALIAKDKYGDDTGWLVDIYSKTWFEELRNRRKFLRNFYEAESGLNKRNAYLKVLNWHRNNTAVLNFFKLPIVKEIYGNDPEYSGYFTYTDEVMNKYEQAIKDTLGPRYDDTIENLLNKLEKFKEIKQELEEQGNTDEIIQRDLWQFLSKYLAKDNKATKDSENNDIYFELGFEDLPFIPKTVRKTSKPVIHDDGSYTIETNTKKTGFYSEEFENIRKDPALLELWDIYKEMAEYIDASYSETNFGRLSYPKVEALFSERVLDGMAAIKTGEYGKIGTMFTSAMHEFKSFFYEKGTNSMGTTDVSPNKIDRSSKKFKDVRDYYIMLGKSSEEAERLANKDLLKTYSSDMDRNFKASLLAAAMHNARLEVEPTAKMLLDYFKTIKDVNGEYRKNSVEKLEHFINKVILNKSTAERGKKTVASKEVPRNNGLSKILSYLQDNTAFGKRFIKSRGFRLLSKQEKIIYEKYKKLKDGNYADNFGSIRDNINGTEYFFEIKDIPVKDKNKGFSVARKYFLEPYTGEGLRVAVSKETFDAVYNKYIEDKLDSLGLSLSLAGFITGILKTLIVKGLGFNMIGGIFNRVEGMHTIMIMDLTGTYWTAGNADTAKEMMAFVNTRNFSKRFLKPKDTKRVKAMDIFDQFIERLGGIQDRQAELEKSADRNSVLNADVFKLYGWSVTNPEYHNQGTVMLSVLMDEIVYDNDGNAHQLLDKETEEFTIFDIDENGLLVVKPEFSETFNFESEQMQNLMVKVSNAVSHSQGNYNVRDIMKIKSSIWGSALMLFKSWMPEAIYQRFGTTESVGNEVNVNLAYGKRQSEGRFIKAFKASKTSALVYALSALGVSYGLLGGVGLIGASTLTAFVYKKFLSKVSNKQSLENDVNTISKLAEFMKSVLIESLNYPSRVLSSVPGMKKLRMENKTFTGDKFSPLNKDEVASLKAMSRELAILMTLLMTKIAMGMLMFDDEDDKDSARRKRYNFVQNQFSKAITTLNSYTSPTTFYQDSSRIGAISFLENLHKLVKYSVFESDAEKRNKSFWGIAPVPRDMTRTIRGLMPWEDDFAYDDFSDLGELSWIQRFVKAAKTDGESISEKDWTNMKKEDRQKAKEKYMELANGNKKVLKIITDNVLEEKYGSRKSNEKFSEAIERVEKGDVKVSKSKLKNKLRYKLREEGVSEEIIQDILLERF